MADTVGVLTLGSHTVIGALVAALRERKAEVAHALLDRLDRKIARVDADEPAP